MRRFRFRLERVLRMRRQWLRQERAQMAAALRALQTAEASCRWADQARQRLLEAMAARFYEDGHVRRIDGQRLAETVGVLEELGRRGAYWAVERARAEEAAGEQRARVVEAHKNVRVLELLKERRRNEHLRETEREERAALDEAGAAAYIRRRLEDG